MTKNQINMLLKRSIKNGEQFNDLIDTPKNQSVSLGKGDTFYSVALMSRWAKKYYKEVQRLAPVLKGNDLEQTCKNIHSFLYWYLQYKADGDLQNLRSPSNSWQTRQEGIDCKSYSIFASCLLLNLGIKHYIRQIKQPSFNPKQYTHVYVIVPKDTQKGDLTGGYYVIDGTISKTIEPTYTQKKDFFMDNRLPHLGLNASRTKTRKIKISSNKRKNARKAKSPRNTSGRFPF